MYYYHRTKEKAFVPFFSICATTATEKTNMYMMKNVKCPSLSYWNSTFFFVSISWEMLEGYNRLELLIPEKVKPHTAHTTFYVCKIFSGTNQKIWQNGLIPHTN